MDEARIGTYEPRAGRKERLFPEQTTATSVLRQTLADSRTAATILVSLAILPFLFPEWWVPAALVVAGYAGWLSTLRFRLPMRVPASWDGQDYGELKDGSDTEFKTASGILYLGADRDGKDLWITNSDARRHIFTLGTTGSGKTEFLLGLLVQPMMWGSGCMFVDGKGTPEFYSRVYSLAKRFGREDDVRLINFTGVSAADGADPDAPAGSRGSQSNTLNPFANGSADQIANMVASLMGGGGGGENSMWSDRAVQLVSTLIRVLVELRDRREIQLDVQTIRSYMPLGVGVPDGVAALRKLVQQGEKIKTDKKARARGAELGISGDCAAAMMMMEPEDWRRVKSETTVSALYLRALNGEFSEASRLALQGFLTTLPGYMLFRAFEGQEQESKTLEQHGFLTMQLTKPLGTMADDFGHIFRTPLAEVDMNDVIFNRRILVVLLPALQKAPEETKNLGRIIVAMAKAMMGAASGSKVVGTRREIVDTLPTRSSSPFIAVFDEAGYYLVKGMDVMAAQARSLGFSIVVGAQDLQAMRGDSPQAADSVIANTYLNAIGATVDADATLKFVRDKIGSIKAAMSAGGTRVAGLFASRWMDSGNFNYTEVDRVNAADLRSLTPGEFKFIFQDRIVDGRSFYVGSDITPEISINYFLAIRGPLDTRPGETNDPEEVFRNALLKVAELSSREPVPLRAGLSDKYYFLLARAPTKLPSHSTPPPPVMGFATALAAHVIEMNDPIPSDRTHVKTEDLPPRGAVEELDPHGIAIFGSAKSGPTDDPES